MRAEQLAMRKGVAADFQTTAEASPFPKIRLDDFQRTSLDRSREIIKAPKVLSGGERDGARGCEAQPLRR